MPMDAFVKVDNLRKRFGDLAAVDGVSFEVGDGHTLALLGPSGCGKTTILRSIAGLETPEHGSIAIGDRNVFDSASRTNLLPEERELGATILLYAQGTETVSVALVLLSEHSSASMAALAVIQIILLLGAFLLFRLTRVSLVQS